MEHKEAEKAVKDLIGSGKIIFPIHEIHKPNGTFEEVQENVYLKYKGPKRIVVTIKTETN